MKHYKIRNLDKGGFYISPRVTFPGLHELVRHYMSERGRTLHLGPTLSACLPRFLSGVPLHPRPSLSMLLHSPHPHPSA